MNRCPNCHQGIPVDAGACPHCQASLVDETVKVDPSEFDDLHSGENSDGMSTLQHSDGQRGEELSGSGDREEQGASEDQQRDDDPFSTLPPDESELHVSDELKTLDLAPVSEESDPSATGDWQQTLRPNELDDEADFEVDDDALTDSAEDLKASSSDDIGTIILPETSSPTPQDVGATLDLPLEGDDDNSRTVDIDSHDTRETGEIRLSGSEGRLKRLWHGVAGDSANPMHSLQAVGMEASENVFERVALRKVADAGTSEVVSADYQIVGKLGEGAMGVVLSAQQSGVERIVALKTAKPNYQKNDESRRRFLYEAQITADLGHSNIVPIYELGSSQEGMLFYSMKLVEGTPWSEVIHQKAREENLGIFMKVCDAIAFAHSKGVIHRDLKPENTMLGTFGEVFVTDWGTAINLRRDSSELATIATKGTRHLTLRDASGFHQGDAVFLTDGNKLYDRRVIDHFDDSNPNRIYFRKKITREYPPGPGIRVCKMMTMAGTPCYMAPEMASHQLEKLAPTSDIYVLGAILYEMVSGKPPHTGSSVTDCLRTALANAVVEQEPDDPLLKIAFKAMATAPDERYETVEDLQEAVREYSRHSESVALSVRSQKLLEQAVEQKDYEAFSRTIFGFQDALDLWPENSAARNGLQQARLAFGQAAFDKRDYDLVLQTLNQEAKDEKKLYDRALVARKRSQERESTLRLLKRAVAAILVVAIVGLSGLTLFAFKQRAQATLAKQEAEASAVEAKKSAEAEREQRKKAELAEQQAISERDRADKARQEAVLAAKAEETAKQVALTEKKKAEAAALAEIEARKNAVAAQRQAETAKEAELAAKQKAERRAAQIQLGEYQSSLALAKSQLESFDVAATQNILSRFQDLTSQVFLGQDPDFDTWGWQRLRLLSNSDLPVVNIDGSVQATDVSSAGLAVVGTSNGMVAILENQASGLQIRQQRKEPNSRIEAVALTPGGDQVVYAYTSGDGRHFLKSWFPDQHRSELVASAGNRLFQHLTCSANGENLLAGINGGVWIWDLSDDWYNQPQPTRIVSGLRGRMDSLSPVDETRSLFGIRFRERLLLGLLTPGNGKFEWVQVPDFLAENLASAKFSAIDQQVILGLSDNSLMSAELIENRLANLVTLENKHRAPVDQIATNRSGQIVTASSAEPVVHVWNREADQWTYDTFLTGTATNIKSIGWFGNEQVLGLDAEGNGIVWDVARQKQRRRLARRNPEGDAPYPSPPAEIFPGTSSGRAVAVDQNGIIDLWSLVDGNTLRLDSQRWSYIGHTPGAELVDTAVDVERQLVVTAASLRDAEKQYLSNPDDSWEFCLWDQQSGNMVRRWTTADRPLGDGRGVESIEQRISLVDKGRQLLFASDKQTRLVDLESNRETFLATDFGTFFAVSNPSFPRQMMLVKRSGAVRILDLDQPRNWPDRNQREFRLANPSDLPLQGVWSDDGSRFYLVFASGGVAVFDWDQTRLQLRWSSRGTENTGQKDWLAALLPQSGRITSHLDMDLAVTTDDANNLGVDTLHIANRSRGLQPATGLVSLLFDSSSAPQVTKGQVKAGVYWLDTDQGEVRLTDRLHDVLVVDAGQVRSRIRVPGQTYVSTNTADIFALRDGQQGVESFGRPRMLSATASRDASEVYVLLQGGALWKFTWSGDSGTWRRLTWTAADANRILLSPDGEWLMLFAGDKSRLVSPSNDAPTQNLGVVDQACWHPLEEHVLLIARPDGALEFHRDGQREQLPVRVDLASKSLVGLHLMRETWHDPAKQPRWHVVAHLEGEQSGVLRVIPVDGQGRIPANADHSGAELAIGSEVAVSPLESIIASGSPSGTVTIWYAAPTWGTPPGPLFDLEGHRGAAITSLEFSNDGRTLVSADSKSRLYAWLSQDPLSSPDNASASD